MVINMIFWWYQKGWGIFIAKTGERLRAIIDHFSLGSILRTFFAPFRQISAGSPDNASISVRFHAFLDRLLSRIIGAVIRFFILIAGVISIIISAIVALVCIVAWPLVPAAPIIGIILTCAQVTIL